LALSLLYICRIEKGLHEISKKRGGDDLDLKNEIPRFALNDKPSSE